MSDIASWKALVTPENVETAITIGSALAVTLLPLLVTNKWMSVATAAKIKARLDKGEDPAAIARDVTATITHVEALHAEVKEIRAGGGGLGKKLQRGVRKIVKGWF